MFFTAFLKNLYKLYKLRKNQWLSPSELEKLQKKKLKSLIQYAYDKVTYYRKLFDKAGLTPKDIMTLNDLSKIPITSRTQLQALPRDEITAKGINLSKRKSLRTSGSSGVPLDIFVSKKEFSLRNLLNFNILLENGYRITDRSLYIFPPPPLDRFSRYFEGKKIKRLFQYFRIGRVRRTSLFDNPENWLKGLTKFKPNIIRGYPSSIKELALEVQKREIKGINPRIVFCSAELLSPKDKEFISSVFQAEVIDYYSANECGVIAWECREHKGYHIQSDSVIVEFIKEDGSKALDGEEGEMVITSLSSYTMPFVRYKLGDIGIPSDERCPCGRGFPLMKIITGRINDYFILPNGKAISPYVLMHAIRDIPGVARYQVIQSQKEKIRINIVKNETFSSETVAQLKKNYREILGDDVEIEPVIVKEIPKDKIGKFKAIKSEISRG